MAITKKMADMRVGNGCGGDNALFCQEGYEKTEIRAIRFYSVGGQPPFCDKIIKKQVYSG